MTAPHLGPGQVVAGKYTIRALLGFTGEVATYQATSSDGYDVALKLYDPAIGQRADLMHQLDAKRQLVARLPPDCVVPVFDSGYDVTTSAPFSVTEFLQIPSLSKLAETGPLSSEVVATLLSGVSRALDSAHQLGLFHLSLKPSNVFVGPAPAYAVRITDFGDSVVRSATPTHEAYAHCAPWWAPEQMQLGAALGAAADVFAAGLVAFYGLTARSYWMSCQSSPPDLPAWQLEVMGQRVPVTQRAREFGTNLNPAIDGAFARALSANQADRPHSVGELARALASVGVAKTTETPAKTMAFPEGIGYPPAPAPDAAHHQQQSAPGHPAGQYPVAPAPSNSGAGYPGVSSPGASSPGYSATGPADPQGPTPGLPPIPAQQAKKSSGAMIPVIIGVVAAVLIGGAAVVFLFVRSDGSETDKGTTVASNSADGEKGGDSAEGSADATKPAGSGGAAPTPSASVAPEEKTVALTVKCIPDCDKIKVDGEDLTAEQLEKMADEPLQLLPGKHTVEVGKNGYISRRETVTIALGDPVEKKYILARPGRSVTRPCGDFLNPCK